LEGDDWSNGQLQDCYSVPLVAGQMFVITMSDVGAGNPFSRMSLQDPSGTQVWWTEGGHDGEQYGVLAQMFYQPTVSGTYTLIVSDGGAGPDELPQV
jgi:hypothetical protein